jgi:hypothetical protein
MRLGGLRRESIRGYFAPGARWATRSPVLIHFQARPHSNSPRPEPSPADSPESCKAPVPSAPVAAGHQSETRSLPPAERAAHMSFRNAAETEFQNCGSERIRVVA